MSSFGEMSKDCIENFMFVQEAMLAAREENAEKTYAVLKKKYIILKATLNSIGVNITELDMIKE